MFVVAGPAGAGKSTVFPLASFGVDLFSVDDRCAELNGDSYVGISAEVRRRAGSECRAFIADHIAARVSFAVETTMRTEVALQQAVEAKAAGFYTIMFFITTGDVRLNLERITARGRAGGHSSPEADIRAIYESSMDHLPRAVAAFDRVECFDNSRHEERPERVLVFKGGSLVARFDPLPEWARDLDPAERRE